MDMVQFYAMSILDTLILRLRGGSLHRKRLLLEVQYALSGVRPSDALPLTREHLLQSATSAADMAVRYRDLAAALAVVARDKYGISERELSAALGWNRTTLRSKLREGNTEALAKDLYEVLHQRGVL